MSVWQVDWSSEGPGGAIVTVSSLAAVLGSPGEYVDYAATKGAIVTFTKALAKDPGVLQRPAESKQLRPWLRAKILAGGHSLLPMMKLRLARPEVLIDINSLTDLDYIRVDGGEIAIGAMTRHHDVAVGGLGKGGRGFYALDVTETTASDEASVAAKVLWEFPNSSTPAASADKRRTVSANWTVRNAAVHRPRSSAKSAGVTSRVTIVSLGPSVTQSVSRNRTAARTASAARGQRANGPWKPRVRSIIRSRSP